jgi:hypothetical protein
MSVPDELPTVRWVSTKNQPLNGLLGNDRKVPKPAIATYHKPRLLSGDGEAIRYDRVDGAKGHLKIPARPAEAILSSTFSISRLSRRDHAQVLTPEVRIIGTPYATGRNFIALI